VVSLREVTINAFRQHHGAQAEERFRAKAAPVLFGVVKQLTRADITAATMFQATLPPPIEEIDSNPDLAAAAVRGRRLFEAIGCANCHVPRLPLTDRGWVYTEPNPYNPPGNLQLDQAPTLAIDLTSDDLPRPRLKPVSGVVWVAAFSDFKLHHVCVEPSGATPKSNCQFLTRHLWGLVNQGPFMHHGQSITISEAILEHGGEALASRKAFQQLPPDEYTAVVTFLNTLVVPPDGSTAVAASGGTDPHQDP
jgi:cytochrome c peroxidase